MLIIRTCYRSYTTPIGVTLLFVVTAMMALVASPRAYAQNKITVCAVGCNYTDLQQAVDAAKSGDTIRIRAGVLPLEWRGYGIILIEQKSLTIKGDGANRTVIQVGPGGGTTRRTNALYLICSVPLDVTIEDLTLTSLGISTGVSNEGCNVSIKNSVIAQQSDTGIYNNGLMSLVSSSVSKNHTTGRFGNGTGGGILNGNNGQLIVRSSTILANATGKDCGGGIANYGGTVQLLDSTVANNVSRGGCGGGIYNDSGILTARNSHIDFNFLEYAASRATYPALFNRGAGIYIASGSVSLHDSSVNQNTLTDSCGAFPCLPGFGGGIYTAAGGVLTLRGTLVIGNQDFVVGNGAGLYLDSGTRLHSKDALVIDNFANDQVDNCGGPGCPPVPQS